jgi:chloramphenicol 3-O phosphotransferase
MLPAHFIGVFCEFEELIRRERQRGMNRIEQIKGQVDIIHAHGVYDFTVDSTHKSPVECAVCILKYLQGNPEPSAFRQLSEGCKGVTGE